MDWPALLPEMRMEVRCRLSRSARRLLRLTCKSEYMPPQPDDFSLPYLLLDEEEEDLLEACVRGVLAKGWVDHLPRLCINAILEPRHLNWYIEAGYCTRAAIPVLVRLWELIKVTHMDRCRLQLDSAMAAVRRTLNPREASALLQPVFDAIILTPEEREKRRWKALRAMPPQ